MTKLQIYHKISLYSRVLRKFVNRRCSVNSVVRIQLDIKGLIADLFPILPNAPTAANFSKKILEIFYNTFHIEINEVYSEESET